ncbi:molybdopterin converting factor subunit 1 [Rhodovibrio salinarum]|uniref:Molybdopterin synthase sulfur carrier subunit n=1 Tax=Rhodovibrio salinarum TaxID=1087 RepID=A0A934QLI0_9PROT|nr:molybdopterin converting factor subunit 1 [Rhodovibrio salinarum]MBK1698914.1 molybdopterin converting factor subunit 1 [Rhodovibrio salinarum]
MQILYFAWLKTHTGTSQETVEPPAAVSDVAGLLDWLAGRSDGHAKALEDRQAVRVAVNQEYARPSDPVKPGDEVALFPPVTGG